MPGLNSRTIHPLLFTTIGIWLALLSAPAFAESAGGISWQAPAAWADQGQRPMRAATYTVPKAGGDAEDGECAIYFFGAGQGGGVDENIKRWVGQFQTADGKPADGVAKRSQKTVNGIAVTVVDVEGTYLFKPAPMSPKAIPKAGYRMLAAIAEAPEGPVFFKLTAPKKTADAAEPMFHKMLDALKK
jgi:hypothetical protein